MRNILQAAIFFMILCVASFGYATEPLSDRLIVGDRTGVLLPSKCCWVELPETERLRDIRRAESCSAIGGPVGQYKYEAGRLWLTELYRCGGPIPLAEVYPELKNPAVAVWLNGTYHAKLDWLCRNSEKGYIYRTELTLIVERGAVTSVNEENFDQSAC
jgi:hypothetical protein